MLNRISAKSYIFASLCFSLISASLSTDIQNHLCLQTDQFSWSIKTQIEHIILLLVKKINFRQNTSIWMQPMCTRTWHKHKTQKLQTIDPIANITY